MAADPVDIDGARVLVITEVVNEACVHLVSSLKSRRCAVAVSGMPPAQASCIDCETIASDLATAPGRDELARKHFESFQWVILICCNAPSFAKPFETAAASSIEPLSSANRNRHLSALFQAAASLTCLVYVKAMTSSAYFEGETELAVLTRHCGGDHKRIIEVFIGEGATPNTQDFWTEVWNRISANQFSIINLDVFPDELWAAQGDTLSRSSSRKREKHPWNVQDCSFFP
eukprot:Gregarina_sp_Pseudo_9__5694@NODE_813_length_2176_cov_28_307440_g764_i0_p2_GENE_NODE_813_length_2176_cov_28_307440_g764_i0NODE_813_length_2176_cov_28_307440_g764_i0_p2_ORF_typecomplete_len231_score20_70_NODE_813_length_2176_cov_28_307440_g764_i04181110